MLRAGLQVYYKAWLEHFDELWTLNNHAAGACHAHVCLHHHLTDKQIATIRDSGVPIVCQVNCTHSPGAAGNADSGESCWISHDC